MSRVTLTADLVVAIGLVVALVLSIARGGNFEIQVTLASGLVGFLGRGLASGGRKEEGQGGDHLADASKKGGGDTP